MIKVKYCFVCGKNNKKTHSPEYIALQLELAKLLASYK